jgi:predicted DNA-binding transcriptional regulator YafY
MGSRKLEETKRVTRILKILEYLSSPAGRRARRRELSEKFEVSERQITADFQVIRHGLGVALERDSRGYYLKSVPKLLAHPFEFQHALSLVLALKVAMDSGSVDAASLSQAMERLIGLMPEPLSSFLRKELARKSSVRSGPAIVHLESLVRAIEGKKRLEITYAAASRGGEVTTRVVDPCSLVLYGGSWELIAYCHLRKDVRIFNVSRIKKLRMLSERMEDREIDPRELLRGSWGVVVSEAAPAQVRLLFDKRVAAYVIERQWHGTQQVSKRADGRVELTLEISLTDDFIGWILSFGSLVEVLAPEELRSRIAERASEIWYLYRPEAMPSTVPLGQMARLEAPRAVDYRTLPRE